MKEPIVTRFMVEVLSIARSTTFCHQIHGEECPCASMVENVHRLQIDGQLLMEHARRANDPWRMMPRMILQQ